MHIANDVTDLIGNTPLVRINRLTAGLRGRGRRQARVPQSGPQREGPHRAVDDRGGGESRAHQARHHRARAHQRQYRHRPRHGVRRARLQVHHRHARHHEQGAAHAAARLRRRTGADARARRACRARSGRPRRWPPPTRAISFRSSSRTRPIPRSTGAPRPRKSGATPMARWIFWCRASAPAAPSPAWAR